MNSNHNLLMNTAAGTILSVSFIVPNDTIKAALLAAVGATTSLTVSLLLRYILKRLRKKFPK
jgi:hypothetical protein